MIAATVVSLRWFHRTDRRRDPAAFRPVSDHATDDSAIVGNVGDATMLVSVL